MIQRNNWIFEKTNNAFNKEFLIKTSIMSMLNRTINMFEYKNLPETITRKDLEIILQVGGYGAFKTVKEDLYVFSGGLGGEPTAYYLPTLITIANPGLNYSEVLKIDKDCVVVLNDYLYQGLMPMFSKYATILAEAETTLKYVLYNLRVPAIVSADDDSTAESAKILFDTIIKGDEYGIAESSLLTEGLKTHKFTDDCYLKDVIETIQYIKGSWFNEVGVQALFNMKREAINEAETSLNDDILIPSVDTMLECRQIGIDKVNRMYGTKISVELGSIWKQNREQIELETELQEATIKEKEGVIDES